MTELAIPTSLPVDNLSVSSINLFARCPEKWRRRYIDNEYEGPVSPAMVLGGAVGAAEGHAYQHQIDEGERPPSTLVQDVFSDEFDYRTESEEINWHGDTPGEAKDAGVAAVKAYDLLIVPTVTPVAVERRFQLQLEGVEWGVSGYFDVEDSDGLVRDLKVKGRKMSPADAAQDLQPTVYLLARKAEGQPAAGFVFDTMVRTRTPYAEVVPTDRTDRQLDSFTRRLYSIAAEMAWRIDSGNWTGAAPGHWACSERMCGYFNRCEYGGLR